MEQAKEAGGGERGCFGLVSSLSRPGEKECGIQSRAPSVLWETLSRGKNGSNTHVLGKH